MGGGHRGRAADRVQLVRLRHPAKRLHPARRRLHGGRPMSLLPFFQWCEASALGTAIRESPWAFAAIESVHLLALSVIGGAVLLVDLRLLGLGLRNQPLAEIARNAQRWFNVSLAVMLVTGV